MSVFGKWLRQLFCNCPEPKVSWHGYIRFPSDQTNMIAIVLTSKKIIYIWNDKDLIEVMKDNGGYLNEPLARVQL